MDIVGIWRQPLRMSEVLCQMRWKTGSTLQ